MKTFMNRVSASSVVFVASALPVLAQDVVTTTWWHRPRPPVAVPEIDASTGMLAVAAVLAILAFVAERRRRAS
jgi:hypothetical protein